MRLATIESLPHGRYAAHDAGLFDAGRSMALESDTAGAFDADAVTRRADLHRLFEGAVIVSEIDEFVDYGTIAFDADFDA
ncbi:MAG: hypothetical protein U1E89_13035 [Burkholderiaceae bacterium]